MKQVNLWPTKARRLVIGRLTPGATREFLEDRSGATYIMVAFSMIVLMGMAGLGFDATLWYKDKRDIQTVADLSVLAGLHTMLEGGNAGQITDQVVIQAARNNFEHGVTGTVNVNNPPLFGPNAGDDDFVEVIVDLPRELNFASFFLGEEITIQARAVAGTINTGDNCVLALDQTAPKALTFTGSTVVNSSCGVAANSNQNDAIYVQGAATVNVKSAQAFGQVHDKHDNLTTQDPNQSLSVRLNDPYAGTPTPAPECGDYEDESFKGNDSPLSPGVYCGDTNFKQTIVLKKGVYIFKNGNLTINAGANISADGPVTLIFSGDTPGQIGGIPHINGNAHVELSAPDWRGHAEGEYQGQYAGMLIIQDSRADPGMVNKFNGGSDLVLSGAIHMPNTIAWFNGGSDTSPGCVQLVARLITFTGDSNFGNTPEACAEQGVASITQKRARLQE